MSFWINHSCGHIIYTSINKWLFIIVIWHIIFEQIYYFKSKVNVCTAVGN